MNSCKTICDQTNGFSLGYAFVEFVKAESAAKSLEINDRVGVSMASGIGVAFIMSNDYLTNEKGFKALYGTHNDGAV